MKKRLILIYPPIAHFLPPDVEQPSAVKLYDQLMERGATMSKSHQPLHVVGAIIVQGDRILSARRAKHKSAPGFWEFPGGKVEPGEAPEAALVREIQEELGLSIRPLNTFDISDTKVGGLNIRLEVIVCVPLDPFSGNSSDHDAFFWAAANDLDSLDWALPDLPAVNALKLVHDLSLLKSGALKSTELGS